MQESVTYQAIFEKGEARGEVRGEARGRAEGRVSYAREMLLDLGKDRFGPPSPRVLGFVDSERTSERMDRLLRGILTASGWDDLLDRA